MAIENCIYCLSSFDPSLGEGDHIIPAALGEFKDDIRFRRICPSCNQRIGICEQHVLQSGPEGFLRSIVQPKSKRLKRRGFASQRIARAKFEWDGWLVSGDPASNDPQGIRAVDQVILRDEQGRDHSIRLFPNMRPEQLREQIDQLAIREIKGIRYLCCDESEPSGYMKMFRAIWPGLRVEAIGERSAIESGVYQVRIHREFRVKEPYFRALAKIAFHYYLTHSQRGWRGDEPTFASVRDFIINGGNKERFFHNSGKLFADPCPPMPLGVLSTRPVNWCHFLAVDETAGTAVAYLRLFVGPSHLPKPICITLAHIDSPVLMPCPAWAHAYVYVQTADGTCCGHVYQGAVYPI